MPCWSIYIISLWVKYTVLSSCWCPCCCCKVSKCSCVPRSAVAEQQCINAPSSLSLTLSLSMLWVANQKAVALSLSIYPTLSLPSHLAAYCCQTRVGIGNLLFGFSCEPLIFGEGKSETVFCSWKRANCSRCSFEKIDESESLIVTRLHTVERRKAVKNCQKHGKKHEFF